MEVVGVIMIKVNFSIKDKVTGVATDYTPFVVSPYKFCNLLDEQLDEASITLRYIDLEYIEPMTEVIVEIENAPQASFNITQWADLINNSDMELTNKDTTKDENGVYYHNASNKNKTFTCTSITKGGHNSRIVETYKRVYIVASDSSAERVVGSGKYEHELYLIERTKLLEGFICDSLTFTNPLRQVYSEDVSKFTSMLVSGNIIGGSFSQYITSNYYKTPYFSTRLRLRPIDDLHSELQKQITELQGFGITTTPHIKYLNQRYYSMKITRTSDNVTIKDVYMKLVYEGGAYGYKIVYDGVEGSFHSLSGYNWHRDILLTSYGSILGTFEVGQTYTIEYIYYISTEPSTSTATAYKITVSNIVISVVSDTKENSGRPALWTIKNVVDRVLDTLEPIKNNRFTFTNKTPDSNKSINVGKLAPEFAFTKLTLREALQQVGGVIHAEPRLDDTSDTIYYEQYGDIVKSHISELPYTSYELKSDINEWCTGLDTSADNLVNQLDYAQGVVFSPFIETDIACDVKNGFITVRTDSTAARLAQDNDTYIPTSNPIYKLNKVIVRYNNNDYNMTPFVYEKADYDALLQSNGGTYPYSKGFALYYTQGEKNIKGLFYKEDNPISSTFADYAIVNIIKKLANSTSLSITGNALFTDLWYHIEYIPVYSTRLNTIKPTITNPITVPRTIAYNQSSNLIESRFYGENLKGTVARLGNIEKTYTYKLAFLSQIPKAGTLFNDNYYISTVSTEILPTYIKCTIGLSKDFNRLSQYIGVSSNKRMWEVSEKQSQERQTIINNYIRVSIYPYVEKYNTDYTIWTAFAPYLFDGKTERSGHLLKAPISSVQVWGYMKNSTTPINNTFIQLPVISSAMGNSMLFTFGFNDNYSAGQKIQYTETSSGASGWWSQYVPYCDYFGRIYELDFEFLTDNYNQTSTNINMLPQNDGHVTSSKGYFAGFKLKKFRKDNREVPQIIYQLSAYASEEDLIVGSGLCKNSPLVNSDPAKMVVYGLKTRLNKISSEVDLDKAILIGDNIKIGYDEDNYNCAWLELPDNKTGEKFTSWAVTTEQTAQTLQVVNDDETTFEQLILTGGELVVGGNFDYDNLDFTKKIYFTILHDIK